MRGDMLLSRHSEIRAQPSSSALHSRDSRGISKLPLIPYKVKSAVLVVVWRSRHYPWLHSHEREQPDIEIICISRVIYAARLQPQCRVPRQMFRFYHSLAARERRQRKLMRKIGTHRIICNSAICVEQGKFELPPIF